MEKLGAIILAAGLSSRMHDFKPLLELGGQTIISRVLSLVRVVGAEPVVVVTGYRAAELEEHLAGERVQFARNEQYNTTQMLDSLLIGLEQIPPDCGRVLIAPADIPLVQPETIRQLLRHDGQFVRPTHKGKNGHPAIMSRELVPLLFHYTGDNGLRGAIDDVGIKITDIEVSDPGVLLDADTPGDYEELRRYFTEEFVSEQVESHDCLPN